MFEANFIPDNLTIEITKDDRWFYEIDLERCENAAELVDWLFHLAHKRWCTPELLKDVVMEIEEATNTVFGDNVQATFGQDAKLNWKGGTVKKK